MRALVITVVHTPADARIRQRQIAALLTHGWKVTLAAPWTAYGITHDPAVHTVDLPRARGRRRLAALVAAIRLLRRAADTHDVVLLHDPELLLAAFVARPTVPVVLDVHEDTAAALIDRPWLPRSLRRLARWAIRGTERAAERRYHLLLAEDAYAARFRRSHPVVPNVPPVPAEPAALDPAPRAVYLGRISAQRGAAELLEVGRRLAEEGVGLDLIGPADPEVEPALLAATRAGAVRWHGYLPNADALAVVDGAVAGLSLLHDVPNYRVSAPTKVYEYLARGVPAITTPLPLPAELVTTHGVGAVVPFEDPTAAAGAVLDLAAAPQRRVQLGRRAHALAAARFDWGTVGPRFVAQLERWTAAREPGA